MASAEEAKFCANRNLTTAIGIVIIVIILLTSLFAGAWPIAGFMIIMLLILLASPTLSRYTWKSYQAEIAGLQKQGISKEQAIKQISERENTRTLADAMRSRPQNTQQSQIFGIPLNTVSEITTTVSNLTNKR